MLFRSLFSKISERFQMEYDPQFIEKMKRGEQQIKDGKTTKIDISKLFEEKIVQSRKEFKEGKGKIISLEDLWK